MDALGKAVVCSLTIYFPRKIIASHTGVFREARLSSLPTDEKRAPLKTPAWEAKKIIDRAYSNRNRRRFIDHWRNGRGYKSCRQTYLEAATATTLVWKQSRVCLPPNPPPKEHKKDTTHESRKHTRKTCSRGFLLTEDYNLLCHTKTIDYKMMVIIQ